MKKLITKLALLLLPVGMVVAVVNYKVDPANILSGPAYIKNIARIMTAGNNADNIANYNERLLQQALFEGKKEKPGIVILGSSRIMEIGSAMFPGKKLQNAGVSHANINDLLALSGLMDSLNMLPQEIIINVDPFLISKGERGASEWHSLKTWHRYFIQKNCPGSAALTAEGGGNQAGRYYTMLTFDYFQQSLGFLLRRKSKQVYDVGAAKPAHYGRYADGSIAYPGSYTHPDTVMTAHVAEKTGDIEIPLPDEEKYKALQCLIDFYKAKKIGVTLLMLPFHPAYYQAAQKGQQRIFDRYATRYAQLASASGLRLIGDFSAARLQVPQSAFYDPYHCSGDVIKKILQNNNLQ